MGEKPGFFPNGLTLQLQEKAGFPSSSHFFVLYTAYPYKRSHGIAAKSDGLLVRICQHFKRSRGIAKSGWLGGVSDLPVQTGRFRRLSSFAGQSSGFPDQNLSLTSFIGDDGNLVQGQQQLIPHRIYQKITLQANRFCQGKVCAPFKQRVHDAASATTHAWMKIRT